jgi:hypothetical protein
LEKRTRRQPNDDHLRAYQDCRIIECAVFIFLCVLENIFVGGGMIVAQIGVIKQKAYRMLAFCQLLKLGY